MPVAGTTEGVARAHVPFSTSPRIRRTDVLVLPVFEGPEPGPGVRDVKGLDLLALFASAGFKGKRGESLLVPNTGDRAGSRPPPCCSSGSASAREADAGRLPPGASDGSPRQLANGAHAWPPRCPRSRGAFRGRRPGDRRGPRSSAPTGSTGTSRSPTATAARCRGQRPRGAPGRRPGRGPPCSAPRSSPSRSAGRGTS